MFKRLCVAALLSVLAGEARARPVDTDRLPEFPLDGPTVQTRMRVERVKFDGHELIMFSQPIEQKLEGFFAARGFAVVKSREQIRSGTIFEGRYYFLVPVAVSAQYDAEKLAGREAVVQLVKVRGGQVVKSLREAR